MNWRKVYIWGGHAWAFNGAGMYVFAHMDSAYKPACYVLSVLCGLCALRMWQKANEL